MKKYLALGPDFCEAPTKVPYEQIIAETERNVYGDKKDCGVRETDEEMTEREISEICENVKVILENASHRKYKTNLTKEEVNGKKKA